MKNPSESLGAGGTSPLEIRGRFEKLSEFIRSIAADHREVLHLPVGDDCRIDMTAYNGIYSTVGKDMARSEALRERIAAESPDTRDTIHSGEELEMLALTSFHKNLGSRFAVMRSSRHDDEANGVDTILFDKETGSPVCALDEVGSNHGPIYQRKLGDVRNLNVGSGGATIKYGLGMEERNGERVFSPAEVRNVPTFYIALPRGLIEKGMNEFIFSKDEQSAFEKQLFEYFMAAIALQIKGLELDHASLDRNLKARLTDFKRVMEELKKKNRVLA